MAQIFPRSSNTIAKASIVALVIIVGLLGTAAFFFVRSPYITWVSEAIVQPVQFSHKHHAGELGISCLYCHTSVEDSWHAGIPPTKTCMNCHVQIWNQSPYLAPVRDSWSSGTPLQWNMVNVVAEFAYFNHSIHVAKGVGCETCHGRVDEMNQIYKANSFQMRWCMECHFNPEQYLRPREEVYTMGYQPPIPQAQLGAQLVKEYNINKGVLQNCDTCHH